MTITDLTNTTWYVHGGWTATAGYGRYAIYGKIETYDKASSFNLLNIGYVSMDASSNSIYVDNGVDGFYFSHTFFTITFESGTDITNPKLIAWLSQYGTLLKVTDLTNTTWKYTVTTVVSSSGVPTHTDSYSVSGAINDVSFTHLPSGCSKGKYTDGIMFNNILLFPDGVSLTGSIGDIYIISFTGGTDVTNPELIAWLSNYADMIKSKLITPTITEENGFLKISNLDENITDLKIYKDGQLYATIPVSNKDRAAAIVSYNDISKSLIAYPANADDKTLEVYVDGELVETVELQSSSGSDGTHGGGT